MIKTLILIMIIGLSSIIYANDGFILDSIQEAQKLSETTNKPALIIFGAKGCVFCTSLKEDILNNRLSPNIDSYIVCYIDIKEDLKLKEQYNISIIPDSRIFINNKEISKNKGYSRNKYLRWLNNER